MDELTDLRTRVTQLETELATVQQVLRQLQATRPDQAIAGTARPAGSAPASFIPATAPPQVTAPAATLAGTPPLPPPPLPRLESARVVRSGEYWFNKLGIALFLFGLAFLFKYAIDQGWLTPAVRVGIGLTIGMLLLGLGLRLRATRSNFAHVLQGGGIAAFYISIFAAFQLYSLFAYPVAFGAMCLVTLLSFGLAVWQSALALALIAALGGLGTPFILYSDTGSVAGLISYTSLVLSGIVAIALVRGWRPLLWTGVFGGWLILLIAGLDLASLPADSADRWARQLGILWAGLLFWLLPLLWLIRWPRQVTPDPQRTAWLLLGEADLSLLTLLTPFAGLALTAHTWQLAKTEAGLVALGLVGLTGLAAWLLWSRFKLRSLAYAHALTAALLGTTSVLLLLEGNPLLIVLAGEGLLLHSIAARRRDLLVASLGHALFAGIGLAVAVRLLNPPPSPVLLNAQSLTHLLVVGLMYAASFWVRPAGLRQVYWLAVHLLVLTLLGRDLGTLADGSAYISIAWGLYGLVLLLIGLRRDVTPCTLYGIGTLALVVVKLVVFDLAALAAIWRILLFMGFGSLFLLLSYYFQALWRPRGRPLAPAPETGDKE